MRHFAFWIGITLPLTLSATSDARHRPAGVVYALSNDPAGNSVLVYDRARSGELSPAATYATGGLGTGAGLGSQGSLVLSADGRLLFAANTGSNDVSMFFAAGDRLSLIDRIDSGGTRPISLDYSDGLLYVLNQENINGFEVERWGLVPLDGSTRPLSGPASGPAQIAFDPTGTTLVVTEKATNSILTYSLDDSARPGEAVVHSSAGATPFGFAMTTSRQGWFVLDRLVVSDAFGGAAGASALSSYTLFDGGRLEAVTALAATDQTAACWVVITSSGRFAYTSNTGSGSISGFRIERDGSLIRLDDGRTGVTGDGSRPIDMALGGRFLYVNNAGTHTLGIFAVGEDGSLAPRGTIEGLPPAAAGVAAR